MRSICALILCCLFLFACQREVLPSETTVTLKFNAEFEGDELVFFQEYMNVSGHSMTVETLKSYFTNVALVNDNGAEVLLTDVVLIDFSIPEEVLMTFVVPSHNYNKLKFSVGIPAENNSPQNSDFDPVLFAPDHPQSLGNNMWWAWATGYRFMIYEGRIDTTPGTINTADIPFPYSIHMGKDTTFLPLEFGISSTAGQAFQIDVGLDVADCMHDDTDTIALFDPEQNTFHGADINVALKFKSLMQNAWTVTSN